MNLYELNLAAFSERYPTDARFLETVNCDAYHVITAKTGKPTIQVQANDRKVFVHSSYDPEGEARRWAANVSLSTRDLLIILGFGMGYHVTEILKDAPEDIEIIIVETEPGLLKQAFYHRDFRVMLKSKNIHIVLGDDVLKLIRIFRSKYDFYRLDKIKIEAYPPLLRIHETSYDLFQRTLFDQLLMSLFTLNTILRYSFDWTRNFFLNLKESTINPGVNNLFGRLNNKPAILVSAGPSVKKNIHLLKKAKNKVFILCVGSILRVLLNEGIIPDLVISIDGGIGNYGHFKGLTNHKVPLVFDPMLHHRIVEEHPGIKFVAHCNEQFIREMDYVVFEDKGRLNLGPSVANIGLDLLVKMGANPIIFVGQDLAYTGGRSHATGTKHGVRTVENLKQSKRYLEVEGINGETLLTDRALYSFLKWFESYIKKHGGIDFINASEGGARIPGTRAMRLEEFLAVNQYETTDYEKWLSEIHRDVGPLEFDVKEWMDRISEVKEQVGKIRKAAWRGFQKAQELREYYDRQTLDYRKIRKTIKSLERIDAKIKENQQVSKMINLLFQPFITSLSHFIDKKSPDETERDKGQRISHENVLLYSGIYQVAATAEQIVNITINRAKNEFGYLEGEGE